MHTRLRHADSSTRHRPGQRPAAALGGAVLGLCLSTAAAQDGLTPVVVVRASVAPVAEELTLTGTATARRSSAISSQSDGLIAEMRVDEGDYVAEGQVLAQLDAVLARLELATADAALVEARAELRDALRRRDEAARVHTENLIATSTYESAVAEADIAQAVVSRLEAERDRQKEVVQRHTIRAPFTGVIARKSAEVGQWLQRGDTVFVVVDAEVLRIDVPVPQVRFGSIVAGTPAGIRFDAAPDLRIEGRVTTVVPISDPAGRTFLARIEIDNDGHRFTPGMSARILLRPGEAQGRSALHVPRDALIRRDDGRHQVWVVDEAAGGSTVQPVSVSVERFQGSEAFIGTGVIDVGTRVVVRGNETLRPGQQIRVVEPAG
jgi:RND family efflux transporter MFP subunit